MNNTEANTNTNPKPDRIRKKRIRKIPQVNSVQTLIDPLFDTFPQQTSIFNQFIIDTLSSYFSHKQPECFGWRNTSDDEMISIPPFSQVDINLTQKNNDQPKFDNVFDEIIYLFSSLVKKNEQISKNMLKYRISQKHLFRTKGTKYAILQKDKKKQIVDLTDEIGINTMAKSLSLSKKSVERWKYKGVERKKGGGRKALDPNMEVKLLQWYHTQIALGKVLSASLIKRKAKELSSVKTFNASYGWYEKFKKKYNLDRKRNKPKPIANTNTNTHLSGGKLFKIVNNE